MSSSRTKGALNFFPAVGAWWSYEGRHHLIVYVLVPSAAGGLVVGFDRQIDDWGSLETGLLFLSGLLITCLFQVFQWGRDATTKLEAPSDDPHERGRQERRLDAVEKTYRSIVWATLISLFLAIAVIVINTEGSASVESDDSTIATTVVAVVGGHLALVLVSIVNRIFIVTRSDLKQTSDEVQRRRKEKRNASGGA